MGESCYLQTRVTYCVHAPRALSLVLSASLCRSKIRRSNLTWTVQSNSTCITNIPFSINFYLYIHWGHTGNVSEAEPPFEILARLIVISWHPPRYYTRSHFCFLKNYYYHERVTFRERERERESERESANSVSFIIRKPSRI